MPAEAQAETSPTSLFTAPTAALLAARESKLPEPQSTVLGEVASEGPLLHVRKRDPSEESRPEDRSCWKWGHLQRGPLAKNASESEDQVLPKLPRGSPKGPKRARGVGCRRGQDGLYPLVPREGGGHLETMSRVMNATYVENLSGLMESPVVVGRRIPTLTLNGGMEGRTVESVRRIPCCCRSREKAEEYAFYMWPGFQTPMSVLEWACWTRGHHILSDHFVLAKSFPSKRCCCL